AGRRSSSSCPTRTRRGSSRWRPLRHSRRWSMGLLSRNRVPIGEPLQAALGTPRVVRRLASSPRSRVWLVEFDAAPAIRKPVIGGTDAPARFAREVTALGLAARANPPVVPAVLATDPDSHVLVLEYVAPQPPAEEWPIDYARALARLHATTTQV